MKEDSNVFIHHKTPLSLPMALHLFQPHSSKPPPLPLPHPKLTYLLGLQSYGAFNKFQGQNICLHCVDIRALPPAMGTSSKRLCASKQEPSYVSLSASPSSREEAISQAKTCLAATLQRYLKSTVPFSNKKLKKQKQPRFRVEIPVIDDSPSSVIQLAFEVFSDLNIRRKDSKPSMLLVWPSPALQELADQTFRESRNTVINLKMGSIATDLLNSADLAIVLAPEETQLEEISRLAEELNPKPVIMFNPKWAFEDEKDFTRRVISFVDSFDVVYSFTGLEVQGILSRRRGVVLRCARDGKATGEPWLVMVQEGDKEEMKVVTRFTKRPSIVEVEAVLYNIMAVNSPLTKSIKSVSDFVKNVTNKFT